MECDAGMSALHVCAPPMYVELCYNAIVQRSPHLRTCYCPACSLTRMPCIFPISTQSRIRSAHLGLYIVIKAYILGQVFDYKFITCAFTNNPHPALLSGDQLLPIYSLMSGESVLPRIAVGRYVLRPFGGGWNGYRTRSDEETMEMERTSVNFFFDVFTDVDEWHVSGFSLEAWEVR